MKLPVYLILTAVVLLSSIDYVKAEESSVTILFTNNSNGKLVNCNCRNDPFGGLSERVTFIRDYRKDNPDFLLLDSGGYFDLLRAEKNGRLILDLMDKMGYDIYGLGDQEIYHGLESYLKIIGDYRNKIINASLMINHKKVFNEYKIFEKKGLKIGIIGLVSESSVRFIPPEILHSIEIENPDTTLIRLLPELKNNADYIIILSQMGFEEDKKIAGRWKNIDLIIGGHSQTLLSKEVEINKTKIVQAGKNAGRIGEIKITFSDIMPVGFSYKLIEITAEYNIPEDIKPLIDMKIEKTKQ
jgi:5'-nucleotidase